VFDLDTPVFDDADARFLGAVGRLAVVYPLLRPENFDVAVFNYVVNDSGEFLARAEYVDYLGIDFVRNVKQRVVRLASEYLVGVRVDGNYVVAVFVEVTWNVVCRLPGCRRTADDCDRIGVEYLAYLVVIGLLAWVGVRGQEAKTRRRAATVPLRRRADCLVP